MNSSEDTCLKKFVAINFLTIIAMAFIIVLGLILVSIGLSLRKKSVKDVTLVPSPTGYGYTNPSGMNIDEPVASGCIVNEPRVDCNKTEQGNVRYKYLVVYCYANVTYTMELYNITTNETTSEDRTCLTSTSFTDTEIYYTYVAGQNVSCFTDKYRPDLVSYTRYRYPVLNRYNGLFIAAYCLIGLGGGFFFFLFSTLASIELAKLFGF